MRIGECQVDPPEAAKGAHGCAGEAARTCLAAAASEVVRVVQREALGAGRRDCVGQGEALPGGGRNWQGGRIGVGESVHRSGCE